MEGEFVNERISFGKSHCRAMFKLSNGRVFSIFFIVPISPRRQAANFTELRTYNIVAYPLRNSLSGRQMKKTEVTHGTRFNFVVAGRAAEHLGSVVAGGVPALNIKTYDDERRPA